MRDNTDEKLECLFAAVRGEKPDIERQAECFETRVLARIRERQEKNIPWYLLAWRCVPAFALIAAILTIFSISYVPSGSSELFASISTGQEEYLAKSFMSGE